MYEQLNFHPAGRLFANGTSGTRIYFDKETSAGLSYYEKLVTANNYILHSASSNYLQYLFTNLLMVVKRIRLATDGSGSEKNPTKMLHAQKVETLTVSELNEYVITGEPQVLCFSIY